MSYEKQPTTHERGEQQLPSHEAQKHQERLREQYERAGEKAPDTAHEREQARQEVKERAISGAEYHRPQAEKHSQFVPTKTKKDKQLSFDTTMKQVRRNLKKPERTFSKLIHQPTVEKVSDVAGKTIARPSGIAGGALAVLIGLLSVYGVAKFAGFELSGSEMPLLLAFGYIVGLLVEWSIKATRAIFSPKSLRNQ